MWLETKNYSEIARKTDIPRTSISQAVEECRQYIKQTLKDRNVNYDI
jgi:DNA-directed RNA polymerase specialized sigma24 family protein